MTDALDILGAAMVLLGLVFAAVALVANDRAPRSTTMRLLDSCDVARAHRSPYRWHLANERNRR